jgi:hypothetical protein
MNENNEEINGENGSEIMKWKRNGVKASIMNENNENNNEIMKA